MTVLPKDKIHPAVGSFVAISVILSGLWCFHSIPLEQENKEYQTARRLFHEGKLTREPYMSRIVDGKIQTAYIYYAKDGCSVFPRGGTWGDAHWEDGGKDQ